MLTAVASSSCLEIGQQQEIAIQKRKQESGNSSQFDIWNSIQESNKTATAALPPPYVHPLLRRSSSSLSQKSLEICTESLGSETGSDGFSDVGDILSSPNYSDHSLEDFMEESGEEVASEDGRKQLAAVNYHCSTNRASPPRLFPPPLPSISRRDGPCVHMRHHRQDGRLVVQAIPAPSQNYLHCQREDGRLLLSFIDTTFEEIYPEIEYPFVIKQNQVAEEEMIDLEEEDEYEEEVEEEGVEVDEEEEEEVEVVDRGIVVEVKVSSSPQLQSGGMKVHRSSLVINKFVGGTLTNNMKEGEEATETPVIIETKTKVYMQQEAVPVPIEAEMTAASLSIQEMECWGNGQQTSATPQDNKLLFTSKRMMNREALLHQVTRCSEYHRPLFFWEPCCIATS